MAEPIDVGEPANGYTEDGAPLYSQPQVGLIMGVSGRRISQIEQVAVDKLLAGLVMDPELRNMADAMPLDIPTGEERRAA